MSMVERKTLLEPSGWRRRLKGLLSAGGSPDRVAGSFAVGVLCGTAPCFTGPVFLAAALLLMRINRLVAAGVMALFLANPFVFVLMAFQFWLGLKMLGEPTPAWLVSFDWDRIWPGIKTSHRLLAAYAIGGFSMSFGMAALTFGLVRWLAVRRLIHKAGLRKGG
jgi:uncharacterized protein (DUF2062 family)